MRQQYSDEIILHNTDLLYCWQQHVQYKQHNAFSYCKECLAKHYAHVCNS